MKLCRIDGCYGEYHALGMCRRHYDRDLRHVQVPNTYLADNIRPVHLDNTTLGWIKGVFERLGGCGNAPKE